MSHLNGFFSSWTNLICILKILCRRFGEAVFTNVTFEWFLFHMNWQKMYFYVTSWETVQIENVTWVVSFFMNFFKMFLQVTLLSYSNVTFESLLFLLQWFNMYFHTTFWEEAVVVSFSHELIIDVFLCHTFGSSCSCKHHIWMVSFSHELMPNVYSCHI